MEPYRRLLVAFVTIGCLFFVLGMAPAPGVSTMARCGGRLALYVLVSLS